MTPSPEERYLQVRTTAFAVWSAVGILVLVAAALWGLGRILGALVPFVMAFVIVFLLNVPVRVLEHRGMKRGQAALLCIVVALALLGGVLTLLEPVLMHQLKSFATVAPRLLTQAETAETAVENQISSLVLPPWLAGGIKQASVQLGKFMVSLGDGAAGAAVSTGRGLAATLLDIFLSLIIAFWVLKDLPTLREELAHLAGPSREEDVRQLIHTVTYVVGGYLRGQTIASLSTATISTIGLTLLHVPYSLMLGIIAFFFNFAPYAGPVTTGLLAGILGLFVSPTVSIAAIGCVILAQSITDYVVVPRVMSSQVDLHPTLVIFSLLVGGTLFGVPGLLFAIPVAAVGKGLFVYYYERRTERRLGSEDGALFRHRRPAPTAADRDASTPAAEPTETEPHAE